MQNINPNRSSRRFTVLALLVLTVLAGIRPAQAATQTYGTLLSYNFDTTTWTGAATQAVGTIDVAGSTTPSLGLRSATLIASGPQAITITETNLGKLTLAFSLSASAAKPVTVTVESYDAGQNRTGGLQMLIYPAAPDFYQRYALDLSSFSPSGAGTFVPNAPYVSFSFSVGGTSWQGVSSPEIRVDNLNYALPAYYVGGTGSSDSNSGRSESLAYATPQKALNSAQAGDIVVVRNGTYIGGTSTSTAEGGTGSVASFPRAGTPSKWIVLKNYPGESPLLWSNGWNMINIAKGSNASHDTTSILAYLEVRGIHVRGQGDVIATKYPTSIGQVDSRSNSNGLAVDGRYMTNKPHHIRFADNVVEYCPGAGLGTGEADWIEIENNTSRNNCWTTIYAPSGISLAGTSNFDATDNVYKELIRNNICCGNQTFQPWTAIHAISDGNGIILDVNHTVVNGVTTAAYIGRTLVQSNLSYNNGGSGIHSYSANRVDIINNTAYLNSASPALQYGQIFAGSANDVRIYNNILVAPIANVAAGEKPEPVNTSNGTNIVFSNNQYFGGNTAPTMGTGDVIGDPQFVNPSIDPTVANFRLQFTSPARITGLTQSYSPFLDLDGNPRAATPDKGAYQLIVSAITLTSGLNPAPLGSAIPLTFTVTGLAPTGTVSLYDGGIRKGTVALTGGTATLNLSTLTSGSHSLSATYNGDAVNASCTSSVVTQVVILPSISGTVTLQGRTSMSQALTCTLTPTGTTSGSVLTQTVTPGADGTFVLPGVPAGTYTLRLKGSIWLRKNLSVDTSSGNVTGLTATLLTGDVNGDNKVDSVDYTLVRQAYGTSVGSGNWNVNADVNGDTQVSGPDLLMVRANIGRTGDQ